MSKTPVMTTRQTKFVQEYLACGNATASAVKAGFSKNGASVAGNRMLRNARVQKALQARQSADVTRLGLAREDVLAGLLRAINQARVQANPRVVISGWMAVSRLMGFYNPEVKESKLSAKAQATINRFEAMSDAELREIVAGGAALDSMPAIA